MESVTHGRGSRYIIGCLLKKKHRSQSRLCLERAGERIQRFLCDPPDSVNIGMNRTRSSSPLAGGRTARKGHSIGDGSFHKRKLRTLSGTEIGDLQGRWFSSAARICLRLLISGWTVRSVCSLHQTATPLPLRIIHRNFTEHTLRGASVPVAFLESKR